MPRPLTITEAALQLDKDRATIRRRVKSLGLKFDRAMSNAQFRRLKESFANTPRLPRGSVVCPR